MTGRTAYIKGWATTAVQQGMEPVSALNEAERAWRARQAAEEAVVGLIDSPLDRFGRRRENRTVGCLFCGANLGIYVEGEPVPEFDHDCAADACDAEAESRLAREREMSDV